MKPERDTLEAWFAPSWAGGWAATRLFWACAAALAHGPRAMGIGDAYGSPDFILTGRLFQLNDWMFVTPTHCWIAWAVGLIGLAMVAWGGRLMHVGIALWFVGSFFLIGSEAYNMKAFDRLLAWMALALVFSPAWRRGLTHTWASPFPRYLMIIVFTAIYGSTGMCKLLYDPSWLGSGQVLQHHLLHTTFGLRPVGIIVSGLPWLVAPMAWITVIFEILFPFLIWLKRSNPWVLVVGACFHIGLLVMMDVGPFGFVSMASYPVLLHPEVARDLWSRLRARFPLIDGYVSGAPASAARRSTAR
jgi:hypothetical protein